MIRKRIFTIALIAALGVSTFSMTYQAKADTVDSTVETETATDELVPEEADDAEVATTKNGWVTVDGRRLYYVDGVKVTGFYKIGDYTYYFSKKGTMLTGLITQNGKTYYFSEKTGHMLTGLRTVDGSKHYFNSKGEMVTGFKTIDGSRYYFDSEGKMVTGWQTIGDYKYYFRKSGPMMTGLNKIGKKTYGFSQYGRLLTGKHKFDGKYYLLSKNGAVFTGWHTYEGAKYYAGCDGVLYTGDQVIDGEKYHFLKGCAMYTGLNKVNGSYYYFDDHGFIQTGWQRIDGEKYYFAQKTTSKYKKGQALKSWNYLGGYKYYFKSNGQLVQDVDSILGKQDSYYITVNRKKCVVMIWAKDGDKGYTIPVKALTCSVGKDSTPTVTGTYKTLTKYRWKGLMGPSYGQYATQVIRGYFFHSVAGPTQSIYNVQAKEYNKLGSPASHGCIRLCVRDAKWIYDNCKLGTTVTISDTEAVPFDKPATIKIDEKTNYDPTDPAIKK